MTWPSQRRFAAPPIWKPFIEYVSSRFWPCDAPSGPKRFAIPPKRRAEALKRIVAQSGIDYIADYYSLPGTHMRPDEAKAPLVGDLKSNLDLWAFLQDSSWKKGPDGGYLMRN